MSLLGKSILFLIVCLGVGLGALWIVGGRQLHPESTVDISATPDEVFDWLVSPEKRTQWVTHLQSVTLDEADNMGLPKRWSANYLVNGDALTKQETVQQIVPGSFLSIRSDEGGISSTRVFRLESDSGMVRLKMEAIEAAEGLGKFRFALMSLDTEKEIRSELTAIKRLVEKNRSGRAVFGNPLSDGPSATGGKAKRN